jgi:hypothetical protein
MIHGTKFIVDEQPTPSKICDAGFWLSLSMETGPPELSEPKGELVRFWSAQPPQHAPAKNWQNMEPRMKDAQGTSSPAHSLLRTGLESSTVVLANF